MWSLADIDEAVVVCEPSRRDDALVQLADAFLMASRRLGEPQVALFDHVMLGLARASGDEARAALARTIAPLPNAPLETTRLLALDPAPRVAAPILSLSTRVPVETLADVAARRGPGHLMALASRTDVDPRWAEPLARRANPAVLRVLADNPAAQSVPALVELLANPGAAWARRLAPRAPAVPDPREREAARLRLETQLRKAVAMGEWPAAVASLAALAGIRPEPLLVALDPPRLDPLLVCMKAANLDWDQAEPVLSSRFGRKATASLMSEAASNYARLTRDSAARAMRVLLMRAKTLAAPRAG